MDTNQRNRLRRFGLPLFLAALVLAAVGIYFVLRYIGVGTGPGTVIPGEVDTPGQTDGGPSMPDEPGTDFSINLSEGQEQPEQVEPLPLATGEPLSAEQIVTVLARLPALLRDLDDQQDFRLPDEVVPPPRTGETVEETFPPEGGTGPIRVDSGPLEVLRFAPEGEIPVAPFINLTFNQPMVPITTVEDLSEADVPVDVEPDLEGTWRWLGTKTVNFQVDSELIDRLPMATEYTVTVPAGTTSATGGELAESVQFSFRTPTVTVTTSYPYSDEPQPRDPTFFIAFNQRIDPQAVFETIQVTVDGQEVDLKLLSEAQAREDERVKLLIESTLESRWLAFEAARLLPADAGVSVTIGPGTPSAEGPLLTETAQSYSFRTYAPLTIVDHGCSWYGDECRPLSPLFIRFNNPLDLDAYEEGMLRIDPELTGANVNMYGDTISIQGATKGRTTYRVTVDGDIEDIFGQRLGRDQTLRFRIGSAEPVLIGPDEIFVTLDPSTPDPALSLYAINHDSLDVRIYAVNPHDWPAFQEYMYEFQRTDKPPDPPGRLVFDDEIDLDLPADELSEVPIALDDYMDGEFGHFIVIARPPRGLFQENRYWQTVQTWVQVTQIGLDAFVDHSEMVLWATALKDGSPLEGVRIESNNNAALGTTGEDGVGNFPIPTNGTSYVVAASGADRALLPSSNYYWGSDAWAPRPLTDHLRWYVFDDRGIYRPGEEVHVKGWLRRIGAGQLGDVGLVGNAVESVQYQLIGPQGNELSNGTVDVNVLGGFDLAITLPETTNLGYAQLMLDARGSLRNLQGATHYHNFQIQEFRRPEFEVNARNETTGPYFVGGHAIVAVEARYYTGDPLTNAEVNWAVSSTPTNYAPPNWPGFSFGTWTPWWWYGEAYHRGGGGISFENFSGTTDAAGEHYLRMDFAGSIVPRPRSITAEGTVFDVNRQAWTGTTTLMVHPASLYVGLRSDRYFVEQGEPLRIDLIATDLDGNPVADRPVRVTAARLEWKYTGGRWQQVEADVQECTLGSRAEPVSCSFETPLGGRYRVTAEITDQEGRTNQSQITRWVSGGQRPPSRDVELEEVTLIPDKESYQPGETAEILVQSPFSPAEGLLTVARSGILYTERFLIEDGTITLQVPIEAKHIPNLNIQVDLVGSAPRLDDRGEVVEDVPPRPAYAAGTLNLSIPPLQRTLALAIEPRQTELEPGGETTIDVVLTDARGNPVSDAELAVVVVDEAILALTNYELSDPIATFYSMRPADLSSRYSRSSIILVDPLSLIEGGAAADLAAQATKAFGRGGGEVEEEMAMEAPAAEPELAADGIGGGQPGSEPIRVRVDFNPLATFAPEVRTGQDGEASIRVSLPDNLTRYRVMVVAVDRDGNQFGSGEANLTARLPLMVRPSAPRFLNFGDSFEFPIVLQNQTDEDLSVEVVIRATNLLLTGDRGLRVEVPARDRIEVRLPAATDRAGTARFQIAAVSGAYADAANGELPVYTPATTEAFATYGVVDEGAIAQPVAPPSEVFSQFGGLEINTSSTALQSLTDAVLYLVSYPFECSEQLASRVLGVAALRDVLSAFEAEGLPAPDEIEAAVARDIERLSNMQNADGGFPYWRRGQESIPFNTIHVAHALQRAELKGYEVPANMQDRALQYLRNIESHYPHWYSDYTRRFLSSYALYVRNLMGDRDSAKARNLFNEVEIERHSLDGIGWLWQVMLDDPASTAEVDEIRRFIANRVVETAGAANFVIDFNEQDYLMLRSNRRTDGILLDTLILDEPDSDLIPKLVNGLLAHRTKGHWGNTQENVFVLLALDRYFNTFEAQTPDFVARIWLGNTYAGQHTYEGRTTERHETEIPMIFLLDEDLGGGELQDLIVSKEGQGRLYYRLGLKYAPTDLWLDPIDMGFVVTREYEAVDDPEDVYQDEEGMWHVKAGARVRIRIIMVADSRRYHVALVDPLPAGLEIVNPALAVSGSLPQDPNSPDYSRGWWWWGTWYSHQNLRDERAEAFTTLLWDGVYEYTYVTRATTPGTFVVPPAKAEEMYSPEVFGRSGSDWLVVE